MFVGFSISKIETARHVPLEELAKYRNINVNYDINLRNPSAVRGPAGDLLRVEFTVAINYLNPSIGFIRFEGYCDRAGGDAGKAKEEWDAGRADPVIQNEIANNMVARIVPLAMLLAQNLSLPPAVPLPVINFQKPGETRPREDKFDQPYV
ncbi:MAG: hypothetical protein A4E28_01283 [Methanocella sp. PtaU1.Bin125]|nr:MAG: hypothetical protein A4E28_01283 [Methanocella sp. PtaU1.Bin125]